MSRIYITSAQLTAVANWAEAGPGMAQVTLATDGEVLRVSQGDDVAEFSPAGDELPEPAD